MSGKKQETYKLLITEEIQKLLNSLDKKSQRVLRDNLKKLTLYPYPGSGLGDKEKLNVSEEEIYRLHIGRTWTAFYIILEKKKQVRITDILPIDEAHKRYGEL
ncbi:MAG: type II toxin-antitoxin system RelE/ParE family toxin [Thermoplasmata archaeon]